MLAGLGSKKRHHTNKVRIPRLAIVIVGLFAIQLVLGTIVIYRASLGHVESSLREMTKRVQADIQLENGTWNITKYNADSEIPGANRLYVFANDGFVIDRWRPINGYMNVSDTRQLLAYQTPQTLHTITNQTWRMYSLPVMDGSATIGVVTVSYFNPNEAELYELDQTLHEAAIAIRSQLDIRQGEIDANNVDSRFAPFDISFQVVNQYNRIVGKSGNANSMGGAPDFIDATYVQRALARASEARRVTDSQGSETFLALSEPLTDAQGNTRGVVIAARSIDSVFSVQRAYIIASLGLGAAVLLAWLASIAILHKRAIKYPPAQAQLQQFDSTDLQTICFLKKDCTIVIGDHRIRFAYASNQYYLCQALFSAPRKKWETDELIEKFGEHHDAASWRKVYDAAAAVNKKVGSVMNDKLIVTNNKTYQINPTLSNKIQLDKQA